MRKLIAIATVMIFVFSATGVYACGEKNTSAKASKASANSECNSKATKASTVESNTGKAEVTTANFKSSTTGAKAYCVKRSADSKAAVMKADATSGCHWKGDATKASVMKADANNCPATKDCPVPCNKDTESIKANDDGVKVNRLKAENSQKEVQPEQASLETTSEVVVR